MLRKLAGRIQSKLVREVNSVTDSLIYGLPKIRPNDFNAEKAARLINRPSPFILEIGCNDGADTELLLRAMPDATIHCFEPEPRALAKLYARLGSDLRVNIHPVAIGKDNGETIFHRSGGGDDGDWDYSGSIRAPKEHLKNWPMITFQENITVPIWCLDRWMEESGVSAETIDFIWMDVQGAEADVIAGAAEALVRTRFIYTEYYDVEMYAGQKPLRSWVGQLPNFEILERYPNDVLLKNTMWPAAGLSSIGD